MVAGTAEWMLHDFHVTTVPTLRRLADDVKAASVACGIGNTLGNKGACAIGFNVGKTAVLCVCSHLAAGQRAVASRNRDIRRIEAGLALVPSGFSLEAQLAVEAEVNRVTAARSPVGSAPSTVDSVVRGSSSFPATAGGVDPVAPLLKGGPSRGEGAHVPTGSGALVDVVASQEGDAAADEGDDVSSPASGDAAAAEARDEQSRVDRLTALHVPALVSERYDRVVWLGDLNYRVDLSRDEADALIREERIEVRERRRIGVPPFYVHPAVHREQTLLLHDQLTVERAAGRAFPGYSEGAVTFAPTYKLDNGSDTYDSSEKRRIPSWTDRILFKPASDPTMLELLRYGSVPSLRGSDHRAVTATFRVALRSSHSRGVSNASGCTQMGGARLGIASTASRVAPAPGSCTPHPSGLSPLAEPPRVNPASGGVAPGPALAVDPRSATAQAEGGGAQAADGAAPILQHGAGPAAAKPRPKGASARVVPEGSPEFDAARGRRDATTCSQCAVM